MQSISRLPAQLSAAMQQYRAGPEVISKCVQGSILLRHGYSRSEICRRRANDNLLRPSVDAKVQSATHAL
eukprot:366318-Chlamydomonas_euryale.AAC.16